MFNIDTYNMSDLEISECEIVANTVNECSKDPYIRIEVGYPDINNLKPNTIQWYIKCKETNGIFEFYIFRITACKKITTEYFNASTISERYGELVPTDNMIWYLLKRMDCNSGYYIYDKYIVKYTTCKNNYKLKLLHKYDTEDAFEVVNREKPGFSMIECICGEAFFTNETTIDKGQKYTAVLSFCLKKAGRKSLPAYIFYIQSLISTCSNSNQSRVRSSTMSQAPSSRNRWLAPGMITSLASSLSLRRFIMCSMGM